MAKSKRLTIAEKEKLITIGNQMANVLWNLKQNPECPEGYARLATETQEAWDRIRRELR